MDSTFSKIHTLSDLELAFLLCLVAGQHCLISAPNHLLDALAQELKLIAANVFALSCAVVNCSSSTTLDKFKEAVLVDSPDQGDDDDDNPALSPDHKPLPSFSHISKSHHFFRNQSGLSNELDERRVVDIIIAKDLNLANTNVQTQALELIRTKRLFSHTAMHGASKNFLFVALQAKESTHRLGAHLNDLFAISHTHAEEDGLPNLEDSALKGPQISDASSLLSVVKFPHDGQNFSQATPVISVDEVERLRASIAQVKTSAEVMTYLYNIILHMRLHRYVAGGVSALATRHLRIIVHALAPLHNLAYIPPSLVDLAARKVYAHRIVLATSKTERSLQWGSDAEAVEDALRDITVDGAIEAVIASVESPL